MSQPALVVVSSELQGTIVSIQVVEGQVVERGAVVALVESMKLHHEVSAGERGVVQRILVAIGETVGVGHAIAELRPVDAESGDAPATNDDVPSTVAFHRRGVDDDDAGHDANFCVCQAFARAMKNEIFFFLSLES